MSNLTRKTKASLEGRFKRQMFKLACQAYFTPDAYPRRKRKNPNPIQRFRNRDKDGVPIKRSYSWIQRQGLGGKWVKIA